MKKSHLPSIFTITLVGLVFLCPPIRAQINIKRQSPTSILNDPFSLAARHPRSPLSSSNTFGEIVYPNRVRVQGGPQRQPFDLILRQLKGSPRSAVTAYRVNPPLAEIVFDPQFSQDGTRLLFKVGWPFERFGTYRLHLWDLKNQQLIAGPAKYIANQNIAWSKDGKFIAFILGGDYEGTVKNDGDILKLCVYNTDTQTQRTIATNLGVNTFTWTPDNHLLFQSFSDQSIQASRYSIQNNTTRPQSARHSQIMQIGPKESSPHLLTDNAYGNLFYDAVLPPMSVSPNGQWLAFYGWPESNPSPKASASNKKASTSTNQSPGLYLLNLLKNQRFWVSNYSATSQDFLTWTPDSRKLILTRVSYDSATNRGNGKAKLSAIDTANFKAQTISTLKETDAQYTNRRSTDPMFKPLRFSRDGKFLLIRSWTALKPRSRKEMFYPILNKVHAVNIATGQAFNIAQTINNQASSQGLDWTDSSPKSPPK